MLKLEFDLHSTRGLSEKMGCWERNGEEGVCGVPVQACPQVPG